MWDPVGSPALVPSQQLQAPRAIPRGLRGQAGWAQGEDKEGSRGKVKQEGPAPPVLGKPSLEGEDGAAELGGWFGGSQGHFRKGTGQEGVTGSVPERNHPQHSTRHPRPP